LVQNAYKYSIYLNKTNFSQHDLLEDGKYYVILRQIELEQKVERNRGKRKGKIRLGTGREGPERKQRYSSTLLQL
jgi:hypothetical protein